MFENKKNNKTPMSKSMIILVWVQILATIVSVFGMVTCIIYGDLSVLCYLIPAIFVDASAVTALVLWKRKSENVLMFLMDDRMRNAVEWLTSQGIDASDFFRAFKE